MISGWPCGDQSSVGRSVTTSGSAIVSRSSRWRSPSSTTTVSRRQRQLAGRGGVVGRDRHARVEPLALGLVGEHDQPRGVVAPDAAQPVGDLAGPVEVDERDHVEHARGHDLLAFGVRLDQELAQRRFDRVRRRALLAPDRVGAGHQIARQRSPSRSSASAPSGPCEPASYCGSGPGRPLPTLSRSGRRSATAPRPRRYG